MKRVRHVVPARDPLDDYRGAELASVTSDSS